MVTENIAIEVNDDIQMDAAARDEKAKILREQHKNARFYSVAETFQFLAGIMLPVAMGTAIPLIGKMGVFAAFTTGPALIFLGVAMLCAAVAIGSRYAASRHFHNANLNTTELNAQHTAKYLVQEIKRENACVQEHEQNARDDGRQWTQVVREHPATQLARN